jgi:hypothetical protein
MGMGKASRTKNDGDRRARIAAQREAERRAAQRKRIYWAGGSVLCVAILVVAIVLVKINSSPPAAAAAPTGAALTSVLKTVETVPSSTTDAVGAGGVATGLFETGNTSSEISTDAGNGDYFATVDSSTKLTSGGKPEVLFIGGEYCPYCAAERWAIIAALSRFGTFSGLGTTHSSSTDVYPNTPTFDFYKSSYTSKYIDFTSVEAYGATSTTPLQTPTSAESAVWSAYDPNGAIPFLDLGNQYVDVGNLSPLVPSMLDGKTYQQISSSMAKPTSGSVGEAEDANANYITAGICKLTNNQPSTVCTPAIQTLQQSFAS